MEELVGSQSWFLGLSWLALCPVSATPEQMLLWFVPAGPGPWGGECWTAEGVVYELTILSLYF